MNRHDVFSSKAINLNRQIQMENLILFMLILVFN